MNLHDRILKRFLQLASTRLHAPPVEAEILARAVAESHGGMGAFCQFCLAPAAMSADIGASVLRRWGALTPRMQEVASILARRPIAVSEVKALNQNALLCIRDAVAAIGVRAGMSIDEAEVFARQVADSASPVFAFHQRCMSPEDHTLADLASLLKAMVHGALPGMTAAARLLADL